MAIGDLVTDDYEIEFNGQQIGGASNISVVSFTPFENPEMRVSDFARPLDDGLFPGNDYYGGKSFILEMEVDSGWTGVRAALAAFQTSDEMPIVFQLPTIGKLQINCRVRRRSSLPIDIGYVVGSSTTVSVEFFATDPRVYSLTKHTSVATLAASTAGLTFDATPNFVFGGATSSTVVVDNAGTYATHPLIVITGAIDNPVLENVTSGKLLQFAGSLASGDTLSVDFLNRTVILNGTASRYSWVVDSSAWWDLAPGNNSIRLGGSAGSPVPTATISWYDAFV